MISSDHILEFCNSMQGLYGAGFRPVSGPSHLLQLDGEYLTRKGQAFRLTIRASETRGEIKVWDNNHVLRHNTEFSSTVPQKTVNFIQRSIECN
jgi:hypothetical protein